MSSQQCTQCQESISSTARFCQYCGASLQSSLKSGPRHKKLTQPLSEEGRADLKWLEEMRDDFVAQKAIAIDPTHKFVIEKGLGNLTVQIENIKQGGTLLSFEQRSLINKINRVLGQIEERKTLLENAHGTQQSLGCALFVGAGLGLISFFSLGNESLNDIALLTIIVMSFGLRFLRSIKDDLAAEALGKEEGLSQEIHMAMSEVELLRRRIETNSQARVNVAAEM